MSNLPLCFIVDDHEDTREGYAEYLNASGFLTSTAAGAEELLALTKARQPDVVVLDLQLPQVDGWELTRRLKADPILRNVPIIAVSGCVLPSERARAEQAGCDVFLGKPCDPASIVREARRLVEQRK